MGGGYSTVDDLARFADALIGHRVLGREMTTRVLTGVIEADYGGRDGYGFETRLTGESLMHRVDVLIALKSIERALVCAGLMGFLLAVAEPTSGVPPTDIRVEQGFIRGATGTDSTVRIFRGVPFAAPPVGMLRWRPPQPPVPWKDVRAADTFAPSCLQPPRTGRGALLLTSQRLGTFDEDCLYLNIWSAAKSASDRLPVMVWFPGGGFTTGGGSALVFDGEGLARKGVVRLSQSALVQSPVVAYRQTVGGSDLIVLGELRRLRRSEWSWPATMARV